jgi:hypothetical protein
MAVDDTLGAADLPADVVADLVEHPRRRLALRTLAAEGTMTVTDLARRVAAEERGEAPEAVPDSVVRAVREDLYEHHVPKLTATGVAEYDSMRASLSLTRGTNRVREAL